MRLGLAAIVLLLAVPGAGAATNRPPVPASVNSQTQIVADADSIEYAQDGAILKATGHVVITSGTNTLRADRVTIKLDSRETWSTGHVVLSQGDSTWTGDRLYCNLISGVVYGEGKSEVTAKPFHGYVNAGFRKIGDVVTGDDATVTTCNRPYGKWHYCLDGSHVRMVKNKSASVTHGFLYLARIPIFYIPYWEKSVDGNGLSFVPGYSSRMGAFLLSTYGFTINDTMRGTTHLDYRTRRGLAAGQDISWAATNHSWHGELKLYGLKDQDPFANRDSSLDIDQDRYRVLLTHNQLLDSRTVLMARIHYLSDAYMLDDFFRPEYRLEPQPDNFVTATRRGDNYTASLQVRPRLNDFHDAVTRIPEAQLELPPQQVADLPLYYESQTSGGQLERLYESHNTNDPYSAFRFDTRHELSLPQKVWFLNFVPRIAARGTYYSSTPSTGESGGAAATRALFEAGAQLSFKMFKTYGQTDGSSNGLRHVAEPYANYTYVPDPNLDPEDLYSFDDVDSLSGQNKLQLGVRNKLQVKRYGRPFDLIDLNTWVDGHFDADPDESTFPFLFMDARIRPWEKVAIDCDGTFSLDSGTPERIGAHLIFNSSAAVSTDMEYRFRRNDSSLISGSIKYSPSETWSFTYRARYEIEDSRLEEHNLSIQRNYDCMSVALGLNQIPGYTGDDGVVRENEYQVAFRLWLKAFPKFGLAAE